MGRIKPQALLIQSKKKKGPSRIGVATIGLYCLVVVVMVFFLYALYRLWSSRSEVHAGDRISVKEQDFNTFVDKKKSDIPRYAILSTSKGSIVVELYKEGSPDVDEFVKACHEGHFKRMPFTRVIKNFVIQGGESEENGRVTEDWTSRGKHYSQLDTSLKHEAFMLGTSKVKHDRQKFELFITTAPIPDLNEKLNVFGRVIKGEDVVQEIEEVDTDEHYRPKSPIEINDVTLKQNM